MSIVGTLDEDAAALLVLESRRRLWRSFAGTAVDEIQHTIVGDTVIFDGVSAGKSGTFFFNT